MRPRSPLQLHNVLIGATALIAAGARFAPGYSTNGPVVSAAVALATGTANDSTESARASRGFGADAKAALGAFAGSVRSLSHPRALEDAFRSYFAFKTAHPEEVTKPYLYFVDYGLPSTTPRGYVFDMVARRVVEGPFTVAHGRGSSPNQYGIPTRFSNASGSLATSLGLYVAKGTYAFRGKTGGRSYASVGLQLMGVSSGFNDNAGARGVVAHGAPYVTSDKAGRSEGCPAMEQSRAKELLPKLANGGMVFLFAPDPVWMAGDPWLSASDE